jgi:hypothetical protein
MFEETAPTESTVPKEEADGSMSNGNANTQTSGSMSMLEPLPALHTPHRKRKSILIAGVVLATLDLCCLPITYYYALKFDTNLKLQDGMARMFQIQRHPANNRNA